jgi:predicted glycosyltransferase
MKILQYCQHVLGIGHFFRTVEILKAFEGHEVLLVTGGTGVTVDMPAHVRSISLPALMMDAEFRGLHPSDAEGSLADIKALRRRMLRDVFAEQAPDLFILELYPFGRRSFAYEINPVLDGIRNGTLPAAVVACSLRDILVERQNPLKYESGVLETLNRCFDVLLVHSDPALFRLEESFARTDAIAIPVVYTGFVAPRPDPGARTAVRARLGIRGDERLIVASAGSGAVGFPLLEAALAAFKRFQSKEGGRLLLYGGPLMLEGNYQKLAQANDANIRVRRFGQDFLSCLAAADLSISMAGYNTCMNILAAGVPALVWPFAQNREQRFRAERLAGCGLLEILDDADLQADRMAGRMAAALRHRPRPDVAIDMDGARKTAEWLVRRVGVCCGEP